MPRMTKKSPRTLKKEDKERKRDSREDSEFRQQEAENESNRRQDPEFKEQDADYHRLRRQNPKIQQQEAEDHRLRRQNPEIRQQDADYQRRRRQDPEFKEQDADYHRLRRQNPEIQQQDTDYHRLRRQNPEIQQQDVDYHRLRRQNPEIRQQDADYERRRRLDPEFKEQDADYHRLRRQNPEIQQQDADYHRLRRQNPEIQQHDADYERRRRQNPAFKEQAASSASNRRYEKSHEALINGFRKAKIEGLTEACISCKRLNFPSKLKWVYTENLVRVGLINGATNTTENDKYPLCATCSSYVAKQMTPSLWTGKGYGLNEVPREVKELNQIEKHLVSLRLPFMKIYSARYSGGQYKMKGNVVNVPIDLKDTTSFLPRSLDESNVMAVKLNKRIIYKSYYLYHYVRPEKVWKALMSLKGTSLYRNVDVDQQWFRKTLQSVNKCKEQNDDDEEEEEGRSRSEEEFGTFDTMVMKNDMTAVIAPGEGRTPLFILTDKSAEEKAFPALFGGEPRKIKDPMKNYPMIIRSELLNEDRRFAIDTSNLFYKLRVHVVRQIYNAINFLMVRKRKNRAFTAGEMVDETVQRQLVTSDEAYKSCLTSVVNSPAYFEHEKNKVMAMIRQLGRPTMFLTLSPCERDWEELHIILKEAKEKRRLTDDEKRNITHLNDIQKSQLLRDDPVVCATYFHHRFKAMFEVIRHKNGIFIGHPVEDFYYRIEYQQRGSPHAHMLLWLKDMPKFDPKDSTTFAAVENMIDCFISCSSKHSFAHYHHHNHTFTCYKKKSDKENKKCRFNIPYPPMKRTQILTPLEANVNSDAARVAKLKDIFKRISNLLTFTDDEIKEKF